MTVEERLAHIETLASLGNLIVGVQRERVATWFVLMTGFFEELPAKALERIERSR